MIFNGLYLVHLQILHQWRYMYDEIYRMEYIDFLEEIGLSMQILIDEKLLVIPMGLSMVTTTDKGDGCVILGNQGSSEAESKSCASV